MTHGDVEDQVIMLPVSGEVLPAVIDDPIRTDRSDHVHVPGAAHARHVGTERLGDLHAEGAHASRCAVDQDLLPGPNLSFVPEALEGGFCRYGHGRSFLEREARRLRYEVLLLPAHVLGEGTA